MDKNDEIVNMLKKVFHTIGIEPSTISTGGGSDTNIYHANGIKAVNLCVGMKKVHTLEEYIEINA